MAKVPGFTQIHRLARVRMPWESSQRRKSTQRVNYSKQQKERQAACKFTFVPSCGTSHHFDDLAAVADMRKLQQNIHRRGNRHVDQGTLPKSSLDFFAVGPLLGVQQCLNRALPIRSPLTMLKVGLECMSPATYRAEVAQKSPEARQDSHTCQNPRKPSESPVWISQF